VYAQLSHQQLRLQNIGLRRIHIHLIKMKYWAISKQLHPKYLPFIKRTLHVILNGRLVKICQ
jgi:hypothetical protein